MKIDVISLHCEGCGRSVLVSKRHDKKRGGYKEVCEFCGGDRMKIWDEGWLSKKECDRLFSRRNREKIQKFTWRLWSVMDGLIKDEELKKMVNKEWRRRGI